MNLGAMSECIVVIPCYNESQGLQSAVFLEQASKENHESFLFVDDGSQDDTWQTLQRLCAEYPERLQCMQLRANSGKAEAVRQGVVAAFEREPEFVGYWDADLATPLDAISRFRDIMLADDATQLVMGSRVQLLGRSIRRHRSRHYIGRLFATLASLTLSLPVYDTQCGAKLFRCSQVVSELFATPFRTSWVFDVELLARYSNLVGTLTAKQSIYEYPLECWSDVPGSKLRFYHGLRAAWDLAIIRRCKVRLSWVVSP